MFVFKLIVSILMLPKRAADYVLSRNTGKRPRTPRRSSISGSMIIDTTSLSIFSYIALTLGAVFVSLFLFIVFRDLLFPPDAIIDQPIINSLPKDVLTRADLKELQSQLSLQSIHMAELDTVLGAIGTKIAALQESIDMTVGRIQHVEAAIPQINVKQIDGLQREFAALLQTVEKLEDSHNVIYRYVVM